MYATFENPGLWLFNGLPEIAVFLTFEKALESLIDKNYIKMNNTDYLWAGFKKTSRILPDGKALQAYAFIFLVAEPEQP